MKGGSYVTMSEDPNTWPPDDDKSHLNAPEIIADTITDYQDLPDSAAQFLAEESIRRLARRGYRIVLIDDHR